MLVEIRSTLCRTASRSSDIASSCCWSGNGAAEAVGAIMSGLFCVTGAACGTDQPSRGNELAIVLLAASPYDCQARVATTPMQNVIGARANRIRLPSLSLLNWSVFRSAGSIASFSTNCLLAGSEPSENSDCAGFDVALICKSLRNHGSDRGLPKTQRGSLHRAITSCFFSVR